MEIQLISEYKPSEERWLMATLMTLKFDYTSNLSDDLHGHNASWPILTNRYELETWVSYLSYQESLLYKKTQIYSWENHKPHLSEELVR